MKKLTVALGMATLVAGIAVAVPASAQFAKTKDAQKYREAAFTLMGNHMGRLTAMVKGQVPFDAAKAQESARLIDSIGKLPWEAFVPDSVSDEMKGDPVKEAAKFKELTEKFTAESAKLVTASATLDGLKGQLGKTHGSCKGCHEAFKK
jgi:cytochrome c556